MSGSTSESHLRTILIWQKKFLRIICSLLFHSSCSHSYTESGVQTVCAMFAGGLLMYLFFSFRNVLEKCMSLSHKMKTRRQQRALLHYAKTSKLIENVPQYKAVKWYNMFKEIRLGPVGINQEQDKLLRRFYRDILNLYLNESNDFSAFLKKIVFLFTQRLTHLQFQRVTHQRVTHFKFQMYNGTIVCNSDESFCDMFILKLF